MLATMATLTALTPKLPQNSDESCCLMAPKKEFLLKLHIFSIGINPFPEGTAMAGVLALLLTHLWPLGASSWHKPWATHAACAEMVRRFDWTYNTSEILYRRFHACLARRKDLPDWTGNNRPPLISGEHYPVSVVPSVQAPPLYWITPVYDYVVSNHIRKAGTYEPVELEVFRNLVREGEVVCDLGSHVGSYSIPLAFHVGPAGRVYAFEPFRVVFQLLTGNAAINGLENFYSFNVALGERSEVLRAKSPALKRSSNIGATAVFLQAKEVYGENHVLQYEGEENVKVETFDSFHLEEVHFMKIDVEGALEKVLRGGQETIQRCRPIIACEHGEEQAPELLLLWGYRCLLVLPPHDLWVCVPEENWWRHRWLEVTDFGFGPGGTQLPRSVQLAQEMKAEAEARRGTEAPKLVQDGQDI